MELLVENVQSYPRPPALEPVPQRVRVMLGGAVIADTTSALRVLETHHAPSYYLPRADVTCAIAPSAGSSFCEWKGRAAYWTLTAGGVVAEAAAWSYPKPDARFAPLKDHLAFYAARMEACFVGAVRVLPQPGDFYGGWVTPNLEGRIKGGPGTRHW
ncbi:DUF427 domain-containing protein [uncultured Tateyamaria sp.]|uniref:DUF427 domain-containing protein n=1 Tax=uncultured Tateyamaria sp. TaxID=455651 RepID=UPI00261EC865|nr:DUF427 domain-containing protein [uncultured Tateyamaria sp.]